MPPSKRYLRHVATQSTPRQSIARKLAPRKRINIYVSHIARNMIAQLADRWGETRLGAMTRIINASGHTYAKPDTQMLYYAYVNGAPSSVPIIPVVDPDAVRRFNQAHAYSQNRFIRETAEKMIVSAWLVAFGERPLPTHLPQKKAKAQ
jgi:hypothetical protein